MTAAQDFLSNCLSDFYKYKELGTKAILQADEDKLHWQPNEESNSIATIIRHMHGNMRSRFTDFLTSDGEKPDRNRDSEFEESSDSKDQLLHQWNTGWQYVFDAVESLSEDDLSRTVLIRNEPHSVIQALVRQLTHYGYHVGQIVYIAKMIAGENWQSLSIPKGKSEEFNRKMMAAGK
jgi:hypothetical protein